MSPTSTWAEISERFARREDLGKPERLRALRAYLDSQETSHYGSKDSPAECGHICNFVARSMAPIVRATASDEDNDTDATEQEDGNQAIQRSKDMATDGAAILARASTSWGVLLNDQVLYTLIAFADSKKPWTTSTAATTTSQILQGELSKRSKDGFIVDYILKSYLRPLFSRSRPATITESGRKAEYPDSSESYRGLELENREGKPWKYEDLRAVAVFAWAVSESDDQVIAKHWPLFTPVLLSLLDDSDTNIRSQGLVILNTFLEKLPQKALHSTGLSSVFEQVVFPTLLFLPSLTPEKESVQLLVPSYTCLIALAKRAASVNQREKLLDKIMREGLFAAYFHSPEHVRIVEVLARQTALIVQAMGLHAVKHLKDLIPMLATLLTDTFAMSYPPTLLAAISALQAVITCCWPRIPTISWQNEIIRMLVLCWCNILDVDDNEDVKHVRAELTNTANSLCAAMAAGDVDVASVLQLLLEKEPGIHDLFNNIATKPM